MASFTTFEALERRRLLCAGGEHDPVRHAMLEAAETPLVQPLTAARGGTAKTFRPLADVPAPQGRQQSYLTLTSYAPFTIDLARLRDTLATAPMEFTGAARTGPLVLTLPTPEGGYERFGVFETQLLAPELGAQFPQIKTYVARGIDDPHATARLDINPHSGFHAMVRGESGTWAIDNYFHLDTSAFVSYRKDNAVADDAFRCLTEDPLEDHELHEHDHGAPEGGPENIPAGDVLRTFRLAATTTTAYNSFHGNTASSVLSAVTTAVNRITGIYEVDLSTRLQLVPNNNLLFSGIAGNPSITGTTVGTLSTNNQAFTDGRIGFASYDVGHVFHNGANNGVSGGGIGIVGSSVKARAASATSPPSGDLFAVDYVAHEMGHQFNGRHNFSNCGGPGDSGAIANEPGSGATIMGYAGLCGSNDLQPNSHSMFNHINFNQMYPYIRNTIPAVGTTTPTGNTAPTVNAGADYVIPTRTPYALPATGSDLDGDPVTYSWEGKDTGGSLPVNNTSGTTGPVVRTWLPTSSPTRTIPRPSNLLNNTTAHGEPLTTVARAMNFRVVARDGRGGVNFDDMLVTTVNVGATGFAVTSPNTGGTVWNAGTSQTVTWAVAGTDAAPISTANVNILLSTDGGNTYPVTLASNVANDGSEAITVPGNLTTTGRIKVEAVGNIYFDISNFNLSINAAPSTPQQPALSSGSDSGVFNNDRVTNRDNGSPARALEFSVGGTIAGATVTLYADGVAVGSATATGATTTLVTNGTTLLANGVRNITARQTPVGEPESPDSPAVAVTIDTVAPGLVAGSPAFAFATAPHALSYGFSENVGPTVADADFSVVRLPATAVPVSSSYNVGSNVASLSFPGEPGGIVADGRYTATLGASNVTDIAGNEMAAPSTLNFLFLTGDANNDGTVNLTDFNILAANFGQSGRDFTQGDFNYDGTVNLSDFNLLAARFGASLAADGAVVPGRGGAPLPPLSRSAGGSLFSGDRGITGGDEDDLLA